MCQLWVFTDGSVNTKTKVGYGAYLTVSELAVSGLEATTESLRDTVKLKRFEQTSSTKLELQTMLWSLGEMLALTKGNDIALTVFTDSQNIIGLPGRRARLEQSNYFSKKGRRLNNVELYQQFYDLTARLNLELVKVEGHKRPNEKDRIDKIFSLVDQASRRALRENS